MTKTSELTLSLKAIRETVYALSAMHSYMSAADRPVPPLLTPHHSKGLDRLIIHSLAGLASEYPGAIEVGRQDHDTVSLNAALRQGADASAVRRTIEHLLVARTMWECHTSIDNATADRYRATYTDGADSLKKALASIHPPLKLRPRRY